MRASIVYSRAKGGGETKFFAFISKLTLIMGFVLGITTTAQAVPCFTQIDFLGASLLTTTSGINNSGQIIGIFRDANNEAHGFLYSGGTFTIIDAPGAVSTYPAGINDSGQIIGNSTDANNKTHGFLIDYNTPGACPTPTPSPTPTPNPISINSPSDGATPDSYYVALTGNGNPGGKVRILDNTQVLSDVDVETDGEWEKLVYVGPDQHSLTAQDFNDPSQKSNTINITCPPPGTLPSPANPVTDYGILQKADVILTRSEKSPQLNLYGPLYTHTALYLGGDINGTPLIAEAVTAKEDPNGLGQVRSLSLEGSTIYTDGSLVSFFRPISSLTKAQKESIVSWALQTTNHIPRLSYWPLSDFPKLFLTPYLWWNPRLHNPWNTRKFNRALIALKNQTDSTQKFICSTLVWRAYQQAGIDLSTPNNARIAGILSGLDPAYVDRLRPYFVFPDTILLSGKLQQMQ